jgi:hypothetical protein
VGNGAETVRTAAGDEEGVPWKDADRRSDGGGVGVMLPIPEVGAMAGVGRELTGSE